MKITFLGTGAADWGIDDKDSAGYNRFFSSALIDGVLLIDPGPHIFLSAQKHDIDLSGVKYIINTHPHSDHLNENSLKKLEEIGAVFYTFKAGEEREIGNYSVSSYYANHSTCENSVHFIIEDGEKKLFYGLDSAWLMYDEVKAIKQKGIDLAVLDATIGDVEGDYRIFEHNNLNMVREMRQTLKPFVGRFVISHMARTLHDDHITLSNKMKESGFETAFDGFETQI